VQAREKTKAGKTDLMERELRVKTLVSRFVQVEMQNQAGDGLNMDCGFANRVSTATRKFSFLFLLVLAFFWFSPLSSVRYLRHLHFYYVSYSMFTL
jgi:hypothetical protein